MTDDATDDNIAQFPTTSQPEPQVQEPELSPELLERIESGAPYAVFVFGTGEEGAGEFTVNSNIPSQALGIALAQFFIMILRENTTTGIDKMMALRVIQPFAALADRIAVTDLVQHPTAPIPGHLFHNAKAFVDALKPGDSPAPASPAVE